MRNLILACLSIQNHIILFPILNYNSKENGKLSSTSLLHSFRFYGNTTYQLFDTRLILCIEENEIEAI